MSNIKITQLPELAPTPLAGSDVFPVVSGNVTYQVTANAIATFAGGGANTGNVTFDDITIQGTGDEFGGSGLYLAPGTASTANLQYLRVRGGDFPTHIHLDTGNNVYFDQYFGADDKFVKLEANGNIVINANDLVGNTATWTADTAGNLTLPGGGIVYETNIPDGGLSGLTIALAPSGGTDADQQLLIYPTANDGNHLHLTTGNLLNTELYLGSDNFYVKLANTGNVVVNSNDGAGNTAQWTFDITGNLTVPGNINSAVTGQFNQAVTLIINGSPVEIRLTTPVFSGPESGYVTISGVGGAVEANGTWWYVASDTDTIALYDPVSHTTPVDSSTWGAYTSGGIAVGGVIGNIAITGGAISLDANTQLTINIEGNSFVSMDNRGIQVQSNIAAIGSAYSLTGWDTISGNTIDSFGNINALTGNVMAAYLYGDGSNITNLPGGNSISNGTSNVSIPTANSNVVINANTLGWTFDDTGSLTAPGNLLINGNILSFGTNRALIQASDTRPLAMLASGANSSVTSVWVENINDPANSAVAGIYAPVEGTGDVRILTGNNATSVNFWDFDSTGNLTASGNISAVGNISSGNVIIGAYLYGDGSNISNISVGVGNSIVNGNSNVSIATADGNIAFVMGGVNAGNISTSSVALGTNAGQIDQGTNSVAIGTGAGGNTQAFRAVAIGQNAGNVTQGASAVAVGRNAGQTTQGTLAVAVGQTAGGSDQGSSSVAVGSSAGATSQGINSVAVGAAAGQTTQGANAVALGRSAGSSGQGNNAIAIGAFAGNATQPANSIILNASGAALNGTNEGLYVDPVRNDTGNIVNVMYYNTSTSEITFGPASGASYGNTQVGTYLASGTVATDYLTSGNVSATGDVTGNNVYAVNAISATGNVRGGNINTAGDVSAAGNITATGTGTNLVRRAYGIAGSNTAVTLDNIQAMVGGTPIRLYVNTVTGSLTGTGATQTLTSGTAATSSWTNVPIGAGAGNAFALSGALTSNGDTAILNLADQNNGTGMWRITGMIANTTANLYGVTIERLV